MAIAEMSRLTLVAMKSDKDKILETLQRTGAVQITEFVETEMPENKDELSSAAGLNADIARAQSALDVIAREMDNVPKKQRGEGVVKDGIGVTADEFFDVGKHLDKYENVLSDAERLAEDRTANNALSALLHSEYENIADYGCLEDSFAAFCDTVSAKVYLGIVPFEKTAAMEEAFSGLPRVWYKTVGSARRGNVVTAVCYSADAQEVENILHENAFTRCTVTEDVTPREKLEQLSRQLQECERQSRSISLRACDMAATTGGIKIYIDYLSFLRDKCMAEEGFIKTDSAFVLSAYVPTEATERVRSAVEKTSKAVYADIKPIGRDEYAPTLMKNGKTTGNFEVVTNMYSVPSYGALDPNGVMGFFFSLFMGLIMADVGYGLMMIIGGFWFASKQRSGTTVYRMAKVFAYGGFFAIAFGILFDSWLGLALLRGLEGSYGSVLPVAWRETYNAFYAAYIDPVAADSSIMGINVPSMLLWCLGLGTLHIAVSLILKAVQSFSRRQIVDAVFGGLVWAFMLISFVVWVFCMVAEISAVETYAMYATIVFAIAGILTAGISEKGWGKITKVFTSAYGLINYASDILSYARLYGLMLSGAQIASIFTNTLAVQMLFPMGAAGILFGVVVIIVGNVFNVAMSLLGAFIHDSRLQYVEFFGKFYEGEGELFTPFGRVYEHIYFKN